MESSRHELSEVLFSPLSSASQKLVVKLTGTVCNIDCTYCGEKEKDLSFDNFMPVDVLQRTLQSIDRKIDLLFHGGEPLLVGIRRFREYLQIVRLHRDRINAVSIQTNGTLLRSNWVALFFDEFADLDIQVSISLDGTRDMNRLRITYGGASSYDRVIRGFDNLHQAGQSAGLLSVIGRHSLSAQREYVALLSSLPNLKFVKINPLFDMTPSGLSADSITPSEFTAFLKGVAVEWVRSEAYRRYPVEPLLSFIQVIKGIDSKYCTFNSRKCLNYTTLYPDGKLGICDNFSVKEFPVRLPNPGSFSQGMQMLSQSQAMLPFVPLRKQCETCEIFSLCSGGCLSQRNTFLKESKALHDDYCLHRKEMFSFMRELVE